MPGGLEAWLSPALMTPDAREQVIEKLRTLPISTSFRRSIYYGWCERVGCVCQVCDLERLDTRKRLLDDAAP